jgi:hypothetical protein
MCSLGSLTATLALVGCSSASSDDVQQGALVGGTGPLPGAIAGMHYRAGSSSGYTDEAGHFRYKDGDTVTFSLGSLEFSPVRAAHLVSPFQLAGNLDCAANDALVHVLQILQSLDQNSNLDDGIQLPELPVADPSQKVSELATGDLLQAIQEQSAGATLVDPTEALDRFIRQIDDEAWEPRDGTTFQLPDAVYRGQGVATDGKSWFFSSANHLQRTNRAFVAQANNAAPIPSDIAQQGGNHIGDIDVNGGLLYAPIEDGTAYLHPYIVTYDAQSLEPTGKSYLLPQALLTEGVPWVAVDGPRQRVYTAEWNPTERINIFDLANDLALVGTLELGTPIGRIQGAKVFGGEMYASSDDQDKSIYKIDLDTGTVMTLFTLGTPTSEVEGLALIHQSDGVHVHIENVVIPAVEFADYLRTRAPLRDAVCPAP